mmetsp:Transcript_12421/g.27126  ORF Transcript_12421/g.27126 Transcript_12421/m.27126 type:complete len:104 (+) Transcript_12421:47-358(+)
MSGSLMDRVTQDNTLRNSSVLSVHDVLSILSAANEEKSDSCFINTSDMSLVGAAASPRPDSFPRRFRSSSSESSASMSTKSVGFNRAVRVRVYARRKEDPEHA